MTLTTTKQCIAIRHIFFEDLGTFSSPITQAGYDITYIDATIDDLQPAFDAELVVVLGGPCGVYDEQSYPFLTAEMRLLGHRIQHNLPTIGICLGAQLIAHIAGATIYKGTKGAEIGYAPLTLTEAGLASYLSPLNDSGAPMFHWHGDTFELPKSATLLASSHIYEHQIFSLSRNILAFQCHPEFNPSQLEHWLIGHAHELATHDIDPRKLRYDNKKYGALLQKNSQGVITQWLNTLWR